MDEMLRLQRRVDGMKRYWLLLEVEAIHEVISIRVGVTKRKQIEVLLDETENATEVMVHV